MYACASQPEEPEVSFWPVKNCFSCGVAFCTSASVSAAPAPENAEATATRVEKPELERDGSDIPYDSFPAAAASPICAQVTFEPSPQPRSASTEERTPTATGETITGVSDSTLDLPVGSRRRYWLDGNQTASYLPSARPVDTVSAPSSVPVKASCTVTPVALRASSRTGWRSWSSLPARTRSTPGRAVSASEPVGFGCGAGAGEEVQAVAAASTAASAAISQLRRLIGWFTSGSPWPPRSV